MAKALIKEEDVTEKELQLWRHHVIPTKHATFEDSKRAIANWYADMRANGLSTASEEDVDAFLRSADVH
jgi:hypothetical protein